MSREVKPGRFAVVAGAVVAATVLAVGAQGVPDAVIAVLGGPRTDFERQGGLSVRYQLPGGGDRVLEIPGVTPADAGELFDQLVHGVSFHPVIHGSHAEEVARLTGATLDLDQWADDDGQRFSVGYLRAGSRAELERALADATARGWHAPEGSTIGFEQVDGEPVHWRTYELAPAALDESMIDSARASADPNTLQSIVLVDLTPAGTTRFCDLTGQLQGRKLAIVAGTRVRSAPIIFSEICGGRISITMGSGGGEREAVTLADLLNNHRFLPRGSIAQAAHPVPPVGIGRLRWLAPLVVAAAAAALAAALAYLVIRLARPRWRTAPPGATGRFPCRRLMVTLLAPLAVAVLPQIPLAGLDTTQLATDSLFSVFGPPPSYSVITLGITPVISAFLVVELIALAIPRLRWRRHDARGRIGLGKAVAGVAVGIALIQGWFMASYLEALTSGVQVADAGLRFQVVTALSLAAGTMLLTVIAGAIREHGLGNGYGALLASTAALALIENAIDLGGLPAHGLAGLLGIAAVAAVTWCGLRWRVGPTGDRGVVLRVPSSGIRPLSELGGIGYLVAALWALASGVGVLELQGWLAQLEQLPWVLLPCVLVAVPVWSWLFARPSLVARVALQAGCDPPSRGVWLAATVVSLGLTGAVVAIALGVAAWAYLAPVATLAVATEVMIATAVVLDLCDDARARRQPLAPAWVVHQIQYLGVIEHVLGGAGIPCHVHAANLRTLLAFFGPWAPAIVLVPEAHAEAARRLLDDALRPAAGQVPVARVA